MPRSRGGAAPARSAPSRPQAMPQRPAAPQQQQTRAMTTAPTARQPPPAQAPAQSGGSGLFGQMASTAAGVAVGSSIGHAIGGFFGGGSSSASAAEQAQYQQPVDNYSQPGQLYNTSSQSYAEPQGPCAGDIKSFTQCMSQNNGDLNICGYYMEQLKACQSAAKQYGQ